MDSENVSSVMNVTSTPVRTAKDMFLGRFKSSEKKAHTPKLSQPSFTEELIDAIGESVISEVRHVDAKDEPREDHEDAIPEEGEEDVSSAGVDESAEGDMEAELAMKAKSDAHKLQMAMDQIEHIQLTNMTLQRTLEMSIKQSAREIALKDQEIAEQRKRAQKAEDEKDVLKMEFTKQKLKMEGDFRSKINQLQSQLNQTKTMQASTGMTSGKSFSARFFMSGKSQTQARVQANATERDYARKIKNLEEQVSRLREENARLQEDQQVSTDFCAHQTSKINDLKEEVAGLRHRLGLYREKIRRDKTKMRQLRININDLEGKAGWVAEQVRRLTEDLDYEKQKHVKPSRMAIVKQVEELQKLRVEVEELRKNTPAKEIHAVSATPASAMKSSTTKKSAQKSAHKVTMAEPEEKEQPRAPVVSGAPAGAYGDGTLAELMARAKRAREQRGVDPEKEIQRHRESKKRREAEAAANGGASGQPADIHSIFRAAMDNRRGHLHEDDEESLMSSSDDGSEFD